jgi:Cdc6-like AAA superfamily ATPase
MNKKITEEQIKDVYNKFKDYYMQHQELFFELKQKRIVDEIKEMINNQNIYDWNQTSLSDYINDLVYMIKGETFARTINKFSKIYFIKNICKDFNETICENAKKSLKKHEEYYKNIIKNPKSFQLEEGHTKVGINKVKNIILYGPPGVGKTHNYQRLISMIENGDDEKEIFDTITDNQTSEKTQLGGEIYQKIKDEKRVEFVTFHQSYSYEDFIEGFRPNEKGTIALEDGIFKRVAKESLENQKVSVEQKNYYIIIDEINRGNISKIFGELITLIEEDKRDMYEVTLPYSKEPFKIPSNLYIIATMNSTDKSIATIDIALRRRFTFLKMKPNSALVVNQEARTLMEGLNEFIKEKLGEDFMLGHSYFMDDTIDMEFVKEYKIKPLLEEYFYSDENFDIKKLLNEGKIK